MKGRRTPAARALPVSKRRMQEHGVLANHRGALAIQGRHSIFRAVLLHVFCSGLIDFGSHGSNRRSILKCRAIGITAR